MELYSIQWKNSAKKELLKINKSNIPLILAAVEELRSNPFPKNCQKLSHSDFLYRIRIRNYRIIYSIYEESLIIEIIRVSHRKDVYR